MLNDMNWPEIKKQELVKLVILILKLQGFLMFSRFPLAVQSLSQRVHLMLSDMTELKKQEMVNLIQTDFKFLMLKQMNCEKVPEINLIQTDLFETSLAVHFNHAKLMNFYQEMLSL